VVYSHKYQRWLDNNTVQEQAGHIRVDIYSRYPSGR
jgi:hypothetical protein